MLPINEALKLYSIDSLDKEIKERRDLMWNMVGTLYPSILNREIEKLLDRKYELWRDNNAGLLC